MNRAEFECIEGRWSGWAFSVAIMLGVLVSTGMPGASFATEDQLRFRSDGRLDRSLSIGALHEACPSQQVEVDDPYHEKRMRYAAWPLRCVLDAGFAERGGAEGLRGNGLLLRALDGYTRPVGGEDLLIPGGFVAYGEPERLADPASTSWFSPIDRRKTDPAPFYLVWTGVAQSDPHATAWPYQLAEIEVAPFEQAFPKTRPTDLVASDAGWGGLRALPKELCELPRDQWGRGQSGTRSKRAS